MRVVEAASTCRLSSAFWLWPERSIHPQILQGEEQKKLDVVTNDVIKRALKFTGKVGVIASEEEDAPVFNKDAYRCCPLQVC